MTTALTQEDQTVQGRPLPAWAAPADFLVSARSLLEYRGMFRLTNEDVCRGRVLDCPGGAASFSAEATRLGADVVSVDPVYALPTDVLAARSRRSVDDAVAFSRDNPQLFSWTFFRSPAHHAQVRRDACETFVRDIAAARADAAGGRSARYVAGALPALPFADEEFALTLSSHLLFVYDDRIDLESTVAAIAEMVRVTRREGEVRVFPLVSATGGRSALVDRVRERLARAGLASTVERVWYEAQRGGNELLRVRRA